MSDKNYHYTQNLIVWLMHYNELYDVYITRKRVKNITLRIKNDGTALCTAPMRLSWQDIDVFIQSHTTWLEKQRKKLAKLSALRVPIAENELLFRGKKYQYIQVKELASLVLFDHERLCIRAAAAMNIPEEKEAWYIEQALRIIPPKVAYFAEKFGFIYKNVTIRNQKTKWGSCSAKKNLNFNYKLVQTPDYVLDYLILHELAHTEHLHHGPTFWARVEQCCPDYKKAEHYLRHEGRVL